jgi:hypothetical protein
MLIMIYFFYQKKSSTYAYNDRIWEETLFAYMKNKSIKIEEGTRGQRERA